MPGRSSDWFTVTNRDVLVLVLGCDSEGIDAGQARRNPGALRDRLAGGTSFEAFVRFVMSRKVQVVIYQIKI